MRARARQRGHGDETTTAYAEWSARFIRFHGRRHPRELGAAEVTQFLESIAQTEKDPLRSLAASREALDFLYGDVLHLKLDDVVLPRPPTHVARKGPAGVTSPLDWLADVTAEAINDATAASRRLQGARG